MVEVGLGVGILLIERAGMDAGMGDGDVGVIEGLRWTGLVKRGVGTLLEEAASATVAGKKPVV